MRKRKTYEISIIDKTYSKIISDETKFYTSDTALELVFKLKETEYTFESAEIVLLNIDDRSLVTRAVSKVEDGFKYELEDDIIAHYGEWRGQVRFEQAGEVYVSSPVKFRIENDLSNDRPPQLSDVQSWVSLKRYADSLVDELKQAVLSVEGMENTFNENETVRQSQFISAEQSRQNTFETNESERDRTFNANETTRQAQELEREKAETTRQTVFDDNEAIRAETFNANEATRQVNENARIEAEKQREGTVAKIESRQTLVETQFDAVQQELTGKDVVSAPEIIAARGGEQTLSARLDKEQQEVTAQLAQTKVQKADISYVDGRIEDVKDGSVKGVYATLSELQTAFPSGNDNIYVVSASGNWYYWNTSLSSWQSGGVYQATQLSIENQKTINNVPAINDYIVGDPTGNALREESKIENFEWELDHATIANEAEGVLYIRPTSGNFGAIYTDAKKIKYTVRPTPSNSPFILVGVSEATFTIVSAKPGTQMRVLEVDKGGANYTILQNTNTGASSVELDDTVIVELLGNELIVNAKRASGTEFIELFRIDLSTYTGATGWRTNPKLGLATDTSTFVRVGADIYAINTNNISEIGGNVTQILFNHNENIVSLQSQIDSLSVGTDNGRWVGKTANFLGDSFTQRNLYPPVVEYILGFGQMNTYGSSGNTITANEYISNPMSTRYSTMTNTADLVVVQGGVNDYGNGAFGSKGGVPIGTNADTTNTTFKGALKVLIEGLLVKYPTQKIAFVTPIQMNEANASLGYKNGKKANSKGHFLIEHVDAMLEICALYGIPCLDMYRTLGLHELNMTSWTLDGLHLNQLGSEYYGQKLAEWLKGV